MESLGSLVGAVNDKWEKYHTASEQPLSSIKREKGQLVIGAQNVNGLNSSTTESVGELLKGKFDILALLETHLKSSTKDLNLANYTYVQADRRYAPKDKPFEETKTNETGAGGLLIYIHDSVTYKVRSVCEYAENNVQFVHIEITSPTSLHLVAIYSPNVKHYAHVISIMSHFLAAKPKETKIMFIGDFNIDWYGKGVGHRFFRMFCNVTKKEGMRQLIEDATYPASTSCIDHIHTNIAAETSKPRVEASGVFYQRNISTDHRGIYCVLKSVSKKTHNSGNESFSVVENSLQGGEHIKELRIKLQEAMNDNHCVLAVFYTFESDISDKQIPNSEYYETHCDETNLVVYKAFSGTEDLNKTLTNFFTKAEKKISKIRKRNPMQTKPQCTIFTRDPTTDVFEALQKKMWFHKWDVVWQPRHVVYCEGELEPTLTRPINGAETSKQEQGLQYSLYRFYACEAETCNKLFYCEKALVDHERAEHSWCFICGKVYKGKGGFDYSLLTNNTVGSFCKTCFKDVKEQKWKDDDTPKSCGLCGESLEITEKAKITRCPRLRYVCLCDDCYNDKVNQTWKTFKFVHYR